MYDSGKVVKRILSCARNLFIKLSLCVSLSLAIRTECVWGWRTGATQLSTQLGLSSRLKASEVLKHISWWIRGNITMSYQQCFLLSMLSLVIFKNCDFCKSYLILSIFLNILTHIFASGGPWSRIYSDGGSQPNVYIFGRP